MLEQVLQSVFSQAVVSVNPLMLVWSVLTSLALGGVLAWVYRYKTTYSKEFAMTLVVLPSLIAMIIFLVNGNLGTSVAVAGAFSLIKFRSPASSSKELLLVFMATAIGLATGMGYLVLALALTLLVTTVMVILERFDVLESGSQWQQLSVRFPRDAHHQPRLEQLLAELGQDSVLETIKVKDKELELSYSLTSRCSEQHLVSQLMSVDQTWTVQIARMAKKKKSL